jgi:phosphate transport system permease protein
MSDRIAKQVITIGGIGTILVVMLVVLVLLGNVLPMFQSNSVGPAKTVRLLRNAASDESSTAASPIKLACGVDEHAELLWVLQSDLQVDVLSITTGKTLSNFKPESDAALAEAKAQCVAVAANASSCLAGCSDGTVRPIAIDFKTEFITESSLDDDQQRLLRENGFLVDGDTFLRNMQNGTVRKQSVALVTFHKPIEACSKPIVCVDWATPKSASSFDESQTWCWGASDGAAIAMGVVDNQVNSFSGEVTRTATELHSVSASDSPIQALMLGPRNDTITSVAKNGRVVHWLPKDEEKLESSLSHLTIAATESHTSAASPLLGRTTMMIGSESGHIESVALTSTAKGQELYTIHRFGGDGRKVLGIASSPEGRLIATRNDQSKASVYYVPTNRRLLQWSLDRAEEGDAQDSSIFFSANASHVGCLSQDKIELWKVEIPFPEASISSFFQKVWYDGYEAPQHVWQSSTGNVEGEYKFGFMPLIFGTLKATFYSMLIGAPIALMAAIFGSEFMSRKWRTRVKPVIELMASVPSVVLGFVGALVLAPILRDNLMAMLLSILSILFLFLLSSHLWLMIPSITAIRLQRWRLPILFGLIPLGLSIAFLTAGPLEKWLFGGSLIQWLSSQGGSGWSGWFCLLVLPVGMLAAWILSGPLSPHIQAVAKSMAPFRFSIVNLGIFLAASLTVLLVAAVLAGLFSFSGWDPRGSVLGPYQERNALLVGAILGFAIIPLIYTISEDALQSVPQHLRSASLGCGATTWQTTIRVVVPTAMSGLFSAMMIGFGRAVGETMVVLMAAGNTPVMDINPLNGYRTLSATLATELPEAARGSTHFHALFLAAFLLFCFTMVANSVAELVRMRFRKRAYQL